MCFESWFVLVRNACFFGNIELKYRSSLTVAQYEPGCGLPLLRVDLTHDVWILDSSMYCRIGLSQVIYLFILILISVLQRAYLMVGLRCFFTWCFYNRMTVN